MSIFHLNDPLVKNLLQNFLSDLKSQSEEYKRDLYKRLINLHSDLFKKRDFDDCVSLIEKKAFNKEVTYFLM